MSDATNSDKKNETKDLNSGMSELFSLRNTFILIGLTGRTGSGCSSVATIMQKDFKDILLPPDVMPFKSNEDRRTSIIKEWARDNWKPFTKIGVSSVLFFFLCKENEDKSSNLMKLVNISDKKYQQF